MSETNSSATRRHHVTREEEADRSLNHTEFSGGSLTWMIALLLLTVFLVPVAQHVVEIRENSAKGKANVLPEVYSIGKLMPTGEQLSKAHDFWDYWALIPSTEAITKFEDDLKSNSVLTKALLSPAQQVMTGTFGVGNEKAYVGLDGWLFYRPDVDYLTSDGFLRADVLKLRTHAVREVQPDPVKAILDTRDQLAKRGIQLVIMPVPTKPMIHPEMLIGEKGKGLQLQNPSYDLFLSKLRDAKVPVYDPTAILMSQKASGSTYLKTDTHWNPEAMDLVAKELASALQQAMPLSMELTKSQSEASKSITAYGDIFQMLRLPADQHLFQKETVTVRPVTGLDDVRTSSPVLLLGDSFSNIYSLEGMGWGASAGLAERLGFHLGFPVDKIVINAGGAFSSRQDLQARLKRGEDRLEGKKIVVWEFCMRDLSQGDWKMLDLPMPKESGSTAPDPGTQVSTDGLTVTGRIAERSETPKPGSVPYKDCVIALHLTDAKSADGKPIGKDVLVYVWGMKDNQIVDGDYAVGKTLTLKLSPWASVEAQYGGYNRMEIDNPDSFDWDVFWGEISK